MIQTDGGYHCYKTRLLLPIAEPWPPTCYYTCVINWNDQNIHSKLTMHCGRYNISVLRVVTTYKPPLCTLQLNKSATLLYVFVSVKYISYSSNTWEKWEYNEAVHQLFIDFKKAYDSVRREALYNILFEFINSCILHFSKISKLSCYKVIGRIVCFKSMKRLKTRLD
jgi:hypothetical protein